MLLFLYSDLLDIKMESFLHRHLAQGFWYLLLPLGEEAIIELLSSGLFTQFTMHICLARLLFIFFALPNGGFLG